MVGERERKLNVSFVSRQVVGLSSEHLNRSVQVIQLLLVIYRTGLLYGWFSRSWAQKECRYLNTVAIISCLYIIYKLLLWTLRIQLSVVNRCCRSIDESDFNFFRQIVVYRKKGYRVQEDISFHVLSYNLILFVHYILWIYEYNVINCGKNIYREF